MIVCMSPIGDVMCKRTAKLLSIVNCCSVDFFHAWPKEACEKVAYNFLKKIEFENDDIRRGVGNFMSEIRSSRNSTASSRAAPTSNTLSIPR